MCSYPILGLLCQHLLQWYTMSLASFRVPKILSIEAEHATHWSPNWVFYLTWCQKDCSQKYTVFKPIMRVTLCPKYMHSNSSYQVSSISIHPPICDSTSPLIETKPSSWANSVQNKGNKECLKAVEEDIKFKVFWSDTALSGLFIRETCTSSNTSH